MEKGPGQPASRGQGMGRRTWQVGLLLPFTQPGKPSMAGPAAASLLALHLGGKVSGGCVSPATARRNQPPGHAWRPGDGGRTPRPQTGRRASAFLTAPSDFYACGCMGGSGWHPHGTSSPCDQSSTRTRWRCSCHQPGRHTGAFLHFAVGAQLLRDICHIHARLHQPLHTRSCRL